MHFFEDTETLFLIGWRLAGPGERDGTLLPRMSHYIVLEPAPRKLYLNTYFITGHSRWSIIHIEEGF